MTEMIICTREKPWNRVSAPLVLVLHPDAQPLLDPKSWREIMEPDGVDALARRLHERGGIERVCPNCGFRWTPDPDEPPDMVP
jgi:hypothetical protein